MSLHLSYSWKAPLLCFAQNPIDKNTFLGHFCKRTDLIKKNLLFRLAFSRINMLVNGIGLEWKRLGILAFPDMRIVYSFIDSFGVTCVASVIEDSRWPEADSANTIFLNFWLNHFMLIFTRNVHPV